MKFLYIVLSITLSVEKGHLNIIHNGTACTVGVCKIPDKTLKFFVIGDWGGQSNPPYTTGPQLKVAQTMLGIGQKNNVHFIVSVGDHFYADGPSDPRDKRFRLTFENVYEYGRSNHVPWYLIAGNHDYHGNIDAQIEYSKLNPRLYKCVKTLNYICRIYPNYSFSVHYELTPSSMKLDVILIDTLVLCGSIGGRFNPKTGRHEDPKRDKQRGLSDQRAIDAWTWLDDEMKKSKADYLFIAGHYPAYTTGLYGEDLRYTYCPRLKLDKLMRTYRATGYLCGHDHYLEYLEAETEYGTPIHHIISGGGREFRTGGQELTDSDGIKVSSKFFFPKDGEIADDDDDPSGFVYAEFNEHRGTFYYYTGDNKMLYKVEVSPRKNYKRDVNPTAPPPHPTPSPTPNPIPIDTTTSSCGNLDINFAILVISGSL